MTRDEKIIFPVGPERPELIKGEVLPSESVLFLAKKIFIFCEGKTEYHYFRGFKRNNSSSRLEIIPRYPNPDRGEGPDVKKLAEQVMEAIDGGIVIVTHEGNNSSFNVEDMDEFHILFDCDQNFKKDRSHRSKFQKAKDMTNRYNINFYLSNYCFEVWILLHFIDMIKSQRMRYRGLRSKIIANSGWNDYQKADPNIYVNTINKINSAKSNASLLLKKRKSDKIEIYSEESNPVTQLGDLIEYLEKQINLL